MKIVYNYIDPVITEEFMNKVAYFEGFSATPYKCPSGIYTIGFGHTTPYKDDTIDIEQASDLLFNDLNEAYIQLYRGLNDFTAMPLGLKQALIDFVFNCGYGRFLSSSMYRILQKWHSYPVAQRASVLDKICDCLNLYVYSKGKCLNGLKKRRQWEISLIQGCLLQR